MSISSIISSSSAALLSTQTSIGVVNTNITNADNDSYARRSYAASSLTASNAAISGAISRAGDSYLEKAALTSASTSAYSTTISDYLKLYEANLGAVDENSDLSSLLDALSSALTSAANTNSTADTSASIVSAASALADQVNAQSAALQSLRAQASRDLAEDVAQANALLGDLAALNDQIVRNSAAGLDVADLEDSRAAALQSLSELIGVRTYTQADNRLIILTESGETLLGTQASTLAYAGAGAGALSADAIYPGAIPALTLNGLDITNSIMSGSIGAAIALRDDILVEEQAALDAFAQSLLATLNGAANTATTLPAPSSLTSALGVASADTFSASGAITLYSVDETGLVSASLALHLDDYSTIGDLAAAINASAFVQADIVDGKLVLSAAYTDQGLAIYNDDSAVGDSAKSFSAYFGFQNIFAGDDAATLSVAAALQAETSRLATAKIIEASVGGSAIETGQGAAALAAALDQTLAPGASLQDMARALVSDAATLISTAGANADRDAASLSYLQSRSAEIRGVNIDEETAALTLLQTQYEANAQMITAAKEMFDTLLAMVS